MIEFTLKHKQPQAVSFMSGLVTQRIVFMGTPEFAVASLDALVKAGCNIVGVVTAPDKPAGRGMQLTQSAVKQYAVEHNLKVLQPVKLKDPDFIAELASLQADLQVVVAFRMLPEIVWNMPSKGTINLHGSLLPQYRGAAPINWAVINGEKETGVTTFKLQHAIDTGDIMMQERFAIGENETAGEVHDRMKLIGAALLVKTVQAIEEGTATEIPQPAQTGDLKHAPKIFTETCQINFNDTVAAVNNLVRGLAPFPAAFTSLNNKKLKVFAVTKELIAHQQANGSYETDGKSFLKFACADGYVHVQDIQLEGKKRMDIRSFLAGYHF